MSPKGDTCRGVRVMRATDKLAGIKDWSGSRIAVTGM